MMQPISDVDVNTQGKWGKTSGVHVLFEGYTLEAFLQVRPATVKRGHGFKSNGGSQKNSAFIPFFICFCALGFYLIYFFNNNRCYLTERRYNL